MIDTSLFAQQFCTIAELRGLGTCYLGTTTYNAPQICEALQLPERVVPVTTVTVGYPQHESMAAERLPVDAVMHQEKYRELTDAEVEKAYSVFENDPMSAGYIKENHVKTLAQVFTDVRYPRESAEYFSKVYTDLLKKNRFC